MKKMIKNNWARTAMACLAVFVVLAGYKALQIRSAIAFAESFPEPSESVKSIESQVMPFSQKLTVLGEVVAPQQVDLYTELPGRIQKLGFQSGEAVSKGQVLLQLDISEELAMLDAQRAQLDLAKSIYKRNKNLFDAEAVSQEKFDRAKADLAAVKAEIARLESVV